METRPFGRTGMQITPIGFGAWAIGGGGWEFAWGPQDDEQSVAAIRRALDLGINWIDTAAVYDLGHSEEIVARALAGVVQRPYVFTKGSMVWNAQGQSVFGRQSGGTFHLLGFGPMGMVSTLQRQKSRATPSPRSAETAAPGDDSTSRGGDDLGERSRGGIDQLSRKDQAR